MERLISPELRRNYWLELTPARLVLMPAVLALVFYFAQTVAAGYAIALVPVAAGLFILITVVWGANLAVTSLAQEVVQRTWDWQRMSSITPLEMTAGKLLGGPLYAWYGGLLCLAVLLAAGFGYGVERVGYWATLLVGFALLSHAGAVMLTGLAIAKYGAASIARLRGTAFLFALAAAIVLSQSMDTGEALPSARGLAWYGRTWPGDAFWLVSVFAFAAWAWTGALHFFRAQLGHRNPPWAFATFALFLMAYLAGFVHAPSEQWLAGGAIDPGSTDAARWSLAAFVGGALTVAMLLLERHDSVAYRRLVQRGSGIAWHLVPRWAIAWALTTLAVVLWTAQFGLGSAGTALVASWLFLLRDTAVILALNRCKTPANALVMVYFAAAYALLPGIFGASSIFGPQFTGSIAGALLPPAIEAALALGVLRLAWIRPLAER